MIKKYKSSEDIGKNNLPSKYSTYYKVTRKICPYCASELIPVDFKALESPHDHFIIVSCYKCKKSWKEEHTMPEGVAKILISVEELKEFITR